jgi:hypothetical protein
MANQPLGPKNVRAAGHEQELHQSSGPFEWPERLSVRRIATEHSATSLIGQA